MISFLCDIRSKSKSTQINQITGGWWRKAPRSRKSMRIQTSSTARERYSASVEEWDMVDCFLEAQVMRLFPRKMTKLVVERWSTGLLAQSTSVKAVRVRGLGWNKIPWDKVPHTYCKTLLAAIKWTSWWCCICWQRELTGKESFRQVNVRYCKAPTKLRVDALFFHICHVSSCEWWNVTFIVW